VLVFRDVSSRLRIVAFASFSTSPACGLSSVRRHPCAPANQALFLHLGAHRRRPSLLGPVAQLQSQRYRSSSPCRLTIRSSGLRVSARRFLLRLRPQPLSSSVRPLRYASSSRAKLLCSRSHNSPGRLRGARCIGLPPKYRNRGCEEPRSTLPLATVCVRCVRSMHKYVQAIYIEPPIGGLGIVPQFSRSCRTSKRASN